MASAPGNARVELQSNPYTLTGDTFSGRSLLGVERRYTIPERIVCTGTGNFASGLTPPAGVRLLITGVSIDWAAAPAANSSIALAATVAGSGILGTADQSVGSFTLITPAIRVGAASAIGSIPMAHPSGLNIVTREGDGTNSLFRVQQAAGVADVFNVTVYYSPLYAADLAC